MKANRELKKIIENLVRQQRLAVVSTAGGGREPHSSLVAFAATEDLKTILFATSRATRKYAYIVANPYVSMLVDNRQNEEMDFCHAVALTIYGEAEEIKDDEREQLLNIYLARHGSLKHFVTSASCALLKVKVRKYSLVRRFQNVEELYVKS